MSLYELSDVQVRFGDRTVLDISRLCLEAGQTYSLQGPNGAGKSTLLGILAFLTPPHAGELRFDGNVVVWRESLLRSLRRQVGVVDQHPVMFSRSVRENVGYGLAIRGMDGPGRKQIVDRVLDLVGLSHLAESYAPRLSGGETQRVAIARALANSPQILLLDEPTASVDTENRVIIEQIVADLRDQGDTTIVLCTHNRSQAWALCPDVISLEDGRLTSRPLDNAFAGQFLVRNGRTWCRIAEKLEVPVPGHATGRGRVVIDPAGIGVSPALEPGPGVGPLSALRLEGSTVLLTVDLGRPLCVQMSLHEFRDSGLQVASLVRVDVGPQAVRAYPAQ